MSRYEIIWRAVGRIPFGRVATYGQIARIAVLDGHSRLVGYALHALPDSHSVPWHRVINAKGRISLIGPTARLQRRLLEGEGVRFSASRRVDLREFQWKRLK
jgi:methylated-DNA-protein-cysteine methyltransferase-like protein